MTQIKDRLTRARIAAGYKTAKEFAEKNGIPQSTYALHEIGKRGLSRGDTLKKYAEKLGVREAWLLLGEEPMWASTNAQNEARSQTPTPKTIVASQNTGSVSFAGHVSLGPNDLPILGYVKAGEGAMFITNGEIQGVTVRPDSLLGVNGAYAVRVHDTSMSPALQPGWLVHVDPYRPCRKGDYVVIQMKDGAAYVKILDRRTEKFIICRQLNPDVEVKYAAPELRSIHRVVGAKFVEE